MIVVRSVSGFLGFAGCALRGRAWAKGSPAQQQCIDSGAAKRRGDNYRAANQEQHFKSVRHLAMRSLAKNAGIQLRGLEVPPATSH